MAKSKIAVNNIFKIGSTSGTTSTNGNIGHRFNEKVKVVAAWAKNHDTIVTCFPSTINQNVEDGQSEWWFHCTSALAAGEALASTSVEVAFIYI